MSQTRYSWWGFVKNIIRKYPDKNLPHENEAVDAAIASTMRRKDGKFRMKLVQMVLFDHSFTLDHAAQILFISERTGQRYHADFIREVAKCFKCDSLMGKEDTPAADVAPVVRCKDCIHWSVDCGTAETVCLKIYSDGAASAYAWQERKPDDFCSYGERRNTDGQEK